MSKIILREIPPIVGMVLVRLICHSEQSEAE